MLAELYLGDGLKIVGHLEVTVGRKAFPVNIEVSQDVELLK